jgi:hypothetical protein
MKETFRRLNASFPLHVAPDLLLDDSTGIERESSSGQIRSFPLSISLHHGFCVLIYHVGDEQQAHWWLKFRDVVSPHQHDNHQCYC